MPDLTTSQLTWAIFVVGVLALMAATVAIVALSRLMRTRHEMMVLRGRGSEKDILEIVSRALSEQRLLDQRIDSVVASQEAQANRGRLALQRFGLIRFDAFDDMGGRLSFAAALIDDHGDGLVLTAINGRSETRAYAKPVRGLTSDHSLSSEERAAINQAAAGRSPSGHTTIKVSP